MRNDLRFPDDYPHSLNSTDFSADDEDWDLDYRSDIYSYAEDISDRYVVVGRKKKKNKSDRYAHEQDRDHSLAYAKNLSHCYAAKNKVSHVDDDGSLNGDVHVSSFNKLKSMEDTSQTIENGDTECTNVVKETMDVNGFQVFSSQVETVNYIFKRHPDTALGFRPKNQKIRRAYMNELLNLIATLCQSPEKLSIDDMSNADETLADLIDVGFKLAWLKIKLNEVSEKKKIVQNSGARLQTLQEQLEKIKQMFLDLESQLQKETDEALAARAPLSFNDVVC
ncbi:MATH domain and coiled-coil domain-containing protein [Cardamine amara subsp. amara]|uniref:MATH domain and coiled-coil domain-containing protein n=1 Tax=Cardamine amara subsp. amara TaxID=228776 RepID=A0ABD1C8F7_CARAN